MNMNNVDDIIFDALFERVVKDKYIAEINAIPSNEELAKLYPLSPQFDVRMKKVFARYRKKEIFTKISRLAQKVAVVVLILSTVFFGVLLTNPEVRAAVGNVVIEWFEKFTSITFTSDEPSAESKELRPIYMPDGYSIISIETIINITDIVISDDSGNQIMFFYRPGSDVTNISIDNENHIIENFIINENTAFKITAIDNEFENGIIFVYENYVIEIWGKIPIDELVKMAESVVVGTIE